MIARLLTATVLLTFIIVPSVRAESVDLSLGEYMLAYGVYSHQDTSPGASLRPVNLRKEAKLKLSAETEMEGGIKAGGVVEAYVDRGDARLIDASYAYVAGGFGRVNIGEHDGAAALLQVEAPSADPYVDGMDPKINTFDIAEMGGGSNIAGALGYFQKPTGHTQKIAYVTPSLHGAQLAVSFAPSVSDADEASGIAAAQDKNAGEFQNALEFGARYERSLNDDFGFTVGGGYSRLPVEAKDAGPTNAGSDDRIAFNMGLTLTYGPATLGGVYMNDNNGIRRDGDTRIGVVGAHYELTGQTALGVSYYDRADGASAAGTANDIDITRLTGGITHEYAPGMTLSKSVSHIDIDSGETGGQGVQVALGTMLAF